MGRYWRVYKVFFSSSLVREMEFKVNFLAKIAQNVLWTSFFVLVVLVIYRNTTSVAGWGRADAFILAATIFTMNALAQAFFFSLQDIPNQVRLGTLDYVVTKPIDTQFWVSLRRFNFDQIGTLIAGVVMLGIGAHLTGQSFSAAQWSAFALLLGCALALFYSLNLALMTTGIWFVKVDNLWVLSESITQVARYPTDIYEGSLRRFLTYFVPLAFLATMPASQLVRGFDAVSLVVGAAWAISALVLARSFWRFAITRYTSASS